MLAGTCSRSIITFFSLLFNSVCGFLEAANIVQFVTSGFDKSAVYYGSSGCISVVHGTIQLHGCTGDRAVEVCLTSVIAAY